MELQKTTKSQNNLEKEEKIWRYHSLISNYINKLIEDFKTMWTVDFNKRWTKNFQMFKLDLEKAEEPEIKLQTSIGS